MRSVDVAFPFSEGSGPETTDPLTITSARLFLSRYSLRLRIQSPRKSATLAPSNRAGQRHSTIQRESSRWRRNPITARESAC